MSTINGVFDLMIIGLEVGFQISILVEPLHSLGLPVTDMSGNSFDSKGLFKFSSKTSSKIKGAK